jgi:hypothetical protein
MINENRLKIKKEYISVREVAERPDWSLEHIRYFGEESLLTICLRRIPVKIAIENILVKKPYSDNPKKQREILQMLDEPQPLHQTDVYRLFDSRGEKIKITRFKTMPIMRLVKIVSPEIYAGFDDMVITASEVARFEFAVMNKTANDMDEPLVLLSQDFTEFALYGECFTFGEKQALAIKYLYDKHYIGKPWVHGKDMISAAGSVGLKPSNLFSRRPDWKKVIVAGRRGYYRINLPFEEPLPTGAAFDDTPSLFDFPNDK